MRLSGSGFFGLSRVFLPRRGRPSLAGLNTRPRDVVGVHFGPKRQPALGLCVGTSGGCRCLDLRRLGLWPQ
eukprot:scaffold190569_cov41-Prasinocladus_malaysianus.AAC.1